MYKHHLSSLHPAFNSVGAIESDYFVNVDQYYSHNTIEDGQSSSFSSTSTTTTKKHFHMYTFPISRTIFSANKA